MPTLFVERSVEIDAPASTVWRVFTDPVLTREIGGEYVSAWNIGGSFGWKSLDGKMLTSGTILRIESQKLLQHNLFAPTTTGGERPLVVSVITYELRGHAGRTTLVGREEFNAPLSVEQHRDATEGWDAALLAVKEVAEKCR